MSSYARFGPSYGDALTFESVCATGSASPPRCGDSKLVLLPPATWTGEDAAEAGINPELLPPADGVPTDEEFVNHRGPRI